MRISHPAAWAALVDRYPLPAGCPVDPAVWPAWLETADAPARDALYQARLILAGEWWADAMEAEIVRGWTVEAIAGPTLERINQALGVFALTPQHRGIIVAALVVCWPYGARLHRWALLVEQRELEHWTREPWSLPR